MSSIDQEIESRFTSEQQKAYVNIIFTGNWIKNLHTNQLKEYDLTTQQYNILRILKGSIGERVPMQTVKNRMVEKSPNATRLTDKLIAKGFIKRERCEDDRRIVFVSITEEGLDLLKEVDKLTEPMFNELGEKITAEEATLVSTILDKLRS